MIHLTSLEVLFSSIGLKHSLHPCSMFIPWGNGIATFVSGFINMGIYEMPDSERYLKIYECFFRMLGNAVTQSGRVNKVCSTVPIARVDTSYEYYKYKEGRRKSKAAQTPAWEKPMQDHTKPARNQCQAQSEAKPRTPTHSRNEATQALHRTNKQNTGTGTSTTHGST
jgi:hypothetical protein